MECSRTGNFFHDMQEDIKWRNFHEIGEQEIHWKRLLNFLTWMDIVQVQVPAGEPIDAIRERFYRNKRFLNWVD